MKGTVKIDAETFLAELNRIPQAKALARKPGHLALMCREYRLKGIIYLYEAELYDSVIDYRLSEEIERAEPLKPDEIVYKRQVLEEVASHLQFCRLGQTQLKRDELLKLISAACLHIQVEGQPVYTARDGVLMLENLVRNSGLLREVEKETYQFERISFREFLAACYIARQLEAEQNELFSQWVFEGAELHCPNCAKKLTPFNENQMLWLLAKALSRSQKPEEELAERLSRKLYNLYQECWNRNLWRQRTGGRSAPPKWKDIVNVFSVSGCPRVLLNANCLVSLLTPDLWHSDMEVRRRTAIVLGEIATAHAVDALVVALKDEVDIVCEAAAEALGKIGDFRAVNALMSVSNENREAYYYKDAEILECMTYHQLRYVENLKVPVPFDSMRVRKAAAEALRNISARHGIRIFPDGRWNKLPKVD